MTPLQQRMRDDLQLRGLSERTREMYVRAVHQRATHYHKSPARITEEELRAYFLYLKNVKHYARNTTTIAICGIRFFFERTLEKEWTIFNLVRPAPEKKLPVILSRAEVRQILAGIRLPRYRVCLATRSARLAQRLGPFRTRRQWRAGLQVSRPLHLSRRYQQQLPAPVG